MRKKPGPQPDPKYGYRRNIAGYKHGPMVLGNTYRYLTVWSSYYGLPVGRIIDSLVQHALAAPDFKLSLAGRRKQLIRPDRTQEVLDSGFRNRRARSSSPTPSKAADNIAGGLDLAELPQSNMTGASGNAVAQDNPAIAEKQRTDSQKEKAMDSARELFARIEAKKAGK